ncbi:hypothetical protein MW887_003632 [Aspergillus wentii]|nr:hypothetical protein MW887_003632 [Aspergillus wentii]
MLDDFTVQGPNGTHQCLVFEILGPNIPDAGIRLSGKMAKTIAKQALVGLDALHQHKIGHGDFHTRNLAFTMPCMNHLSETEFINMLGQPEIGEVKRNDGKAFDAGIPKYIVMPAEHEAYSRSSIKIVDFGESFLHTAPQTLHTPMSVRAPEIIFQDLLDHRVDLWSMGCLPFELFTGQPPFDSFMVTPPILVGQMLETASDALPERWQDKWKAMDDGSAEGTGLQEWLEEVYFDGRDKDLTKEDIVQLGRIVARLLYFEPSSRASARDILDEPWLE